MVSGRQELLRESALERRVGKAGENARAEVAVATRNSDFNIVSFRPTLLYYIFFKRLVKSYRAP
jgi:hypothetical protein